MVQTQCKRAYSPSPLALYRFHPVFQPVSDNLQHLEIRSDDSEYSAQIQPRWHHHGHYEKPSDLGPQALSETLHRIFPYARSQ